MKRSKKPRARPTKAKQRGRGKPFVLRDPAKLASPPADVDSRETEARELDEVDRLAVGR